MPIYNDAQELSKVMQSAGELMNLSEVAPVMDTMLPGIQSVKETGRRAVGVTPTMRAKNGLAGLSWGGRRAGYVGGLIKGTGMGDLGLTLPADHQIGDRRGLTTRGTIQIVSGHQDGEGDEGETSLKHKGDKALLGHKLYPTSWWVVKRLNSRGAGMQFTGWKTDWARQFDVPAGKTQEIENLENDRQNIDIYITLLSAGKSGEEEITFQKAKTDASGAISSATGQASKLKSIGGDDTAIQKTIAAAQAAYDKADYATALSSANGALIAAIDAIGIQEKKNIELEKQKIRDDPNLDAETKKKMQEDLDKQKDVIDTRTETEKKNLGLPAFDIKSPWVIGGIIGIIAVIGIGAAAAVMSKKKKATA
jgi:hypothetical protein